MADLADFDSVLAPVAPTASSTPAPVTTSVPSAAAPAASPVGNGSAQYPWVAPHPVPDGSGGLTNLSDADYAKFMAGAPPSSGSVTPPPAPNAPMPSAPGGGQATPTTQVTPASAVTSQQDPKLAAIDSAIATAPKEVQSASPGAPSSDKEPAKVTGPLANLAAGANEAVAGTLGLPVDLMTGALNLGAKGVNAVAGTNIPAIQNPVGGSNWWQGAMGLLGANPQNVQANGLGDNMARGIGAGVAGAVLPGGLAGQAGRVADAVGQAAPVMRGAADAIAAPSALANAAAGAGAGVGGAVAQYVVPQQYSALAGTVGNLIGGGAVAAGEAATNGLVNAGRNGAQSLLGPISSNSGLAQRAARLAGVDISPQTLTTPDGQTVTASPGQIARAQSQLAGAADMSPGDLAASIPPPDEANPIPGVQGTLGQVSDNAGVMGLERTLRTQGPIKSRVGMAADEARNNQARLDLIRGIASPDAQAETAGNYFQKVQQGIDRAGDLAVSAKQQQAAQVAGQAGGAETVAGAGGRIRGTVDAQHKPSVLEVMAAEDRARQLADAGNKAVGGLGSGSEGQTGLQRAGTAARDPVANVIKNEKEAISRLYKVVEEHHRATVDVGPLKDVAKKISKEIDPQSGESLPASVERRLDAIRSAPDQMRFKALQDMRRFVGEDIRKARFAGNMSEARQLGDIKAAIDQSVNEAVKSIVREEAPDVVSGKLARPDSLLGKLAQHAADEKAAVFTPVGRRIETKPEVVEAGSLQTSHNDDLSVNPSYPQELQPRDRGRMASAAQVDRMSRTLQPDRLGLSGGANEGAPIAGPDGVVESGNGRILAIRRAYAQNTPAGRAYRQWVAGHGVDVSGMREPVLVRTRTTDLSPQDRVQFTREANEGTGLTLGAAERAQTDAQSISNGTLAKYETGDVNAAQNRNFVTSMIKDIGNGDHGQFGTADGRLSLQGAERIRNALLQRAYGDLHLVAEIAETGDPDIKAFGAALTDAAGQMARLRSEIDSGAVDPRVDLGPRLAEAARLVQMARRLKMPLRDVVGQQDALSPLSAEAEHILRFAYGENLSGRFSRNRFGEYLKAYAEEAEQQQTAPRLFGENASQSELLRTAGGRTRSIPASDTSGAGPDFPEGSRQSSGEGGPQGRGSQSGPAGSGDARGRQGTVVEPEGEPLTREAAQSLKDAIARRAALAERTQGAPDRIMAAGKGGALYAVSDSNVGREFFGKGAEGAQSLIRVLGSREEAESAIADYAAHDLRSTKGMVNPDGSLNPVKFKGWLDSHREELTVFPGLAKRFGNAQAAAQDLADLSARRQAIEALNPLAKETTDAGVVQKYFQPGGRGTEAAQSFARDTGGSREAVQSLSDGIAAQFRDKVMPDGVVKSQAYRNFMTLHRPFFDAAPPEIRARFETAGKAQEAVENAQRDLVAQREAYENSAARFYLDRRGEVKDPAVAVRNLLNSNNPDRNAAALMRLARADKSGAAAAGIQRNAVDYVLGVIRSTTEAGTTQEKQIAKEALDKLVNKTKTGRALESLIGKDGMDWLRKVTVDLDREARSYNAIKVPATSQSAADTHGVAAHGHGGSHDPSMAAQVVGMEMLGEGASHVASVVFPHFALARIGAKVASAFGAVMLNSARTAGLERVDELLLAAVRNPEIGRLMLLHPTPAARVGVMRKLSGLIANLSVSGYTTQRK